MTVKVSVIVPIYNMAGYLDRCVSSIVRQSLRELQIILVNNGSTDASRAMMSRFAARDARVEIVDLMPNEGPGFARNAGTRRAIGKYVVFIDSDDWLDPGYAEALYLEAERTNADMVVGTHHYAEDNARVVRSRFLEPELRRAERLPFQWREERAVLMTPPPVWDKLYRREFLLEQDIWFTRPTAEDIPFKWKTLLCAERLSAVPEPYYFARIRGSSESNSCQFAFDAFTSHDIARDWLIEEGLYEDVYPEWVALAFVEMLYLTYKGAGALLRNDEAYARFHRELRAIMLRYDLNCAHHLIRHIPVEWMVRALFIQQNADPGGVPKVDRNSRRSGRRTLGRGSSLRLGRARAEFVGRPQAGWPIRGRTSTIGLLRRGGRCGFRTARYEDEPNFSRRAGRGGGPLMAPVYNPSVAPAVMTFIAAPLA
jgi:glycosyltransferase involved in cell wall biosynthesis